MTSAEHPQADGLAERAVQTVKKSLAKCCVQLAQANYQQEEDAVIDDGAPLAREYKTDEEWDVMVHWISLGYRCSPQMSSKISPFELMYARKPVIPPSQRERIEELLPGFENELDLLATDLAQRAKFIQQAMPIVGDNLKIAQHRDTLRYARVHGGGFRPSVYRFYVGEYVYLRDSGIAMMGPSALQTAARGRILRIIEARPSGVMVLMGRDGKTTTAHCSHLAPCHLLNIDGTIDRALMRPDLNMPCHVCGLPHGSGTMLLCDECNKGFHLHCLKPPLAEVPTNPLWFCPGCDPDYGLTDPAALNNRVYMRMIRKKGQKDLVPEYATIRYNGGDGNTPFTLEFADGHKELMSFDAVLRNLQGKSAVIPVTARPLTVFAAKIQSDLARYDYSTVDKTAMVLDELMPGRWTPDHKKMIYAVANSVTTQPAAAFPVSRYDIDRLIEVIDMSKVFSVLDPWSANSLLPNHLRDAVSSIGLLTSIAALHPEEYTLGGEKFESIISAPSEYIQDIVLALSVRSCKLFAAILVPITYLTYSFGGRKAYLQQLREADRVVVIPCAAVTPGQVQKVWLVVFQTSQIKVNLLRSGVICPFVAFSQADITL
jgi:hypothetical protein